MQLSRLYSNREVIFHPIVFNSGPDAKRLNVILATIRQRKDRSRDSHNLGKTTLIHLIDFLLLKNVSSESHFLVKHADRFADFVFYLELRLHAGGFVTVRRSVADPTRIAFKQSKTAKVNLAALPEEEWDHIDVSLSAGRELLDAYLDLRMIKPWDYRKGVSYFLRSQEDYSDFFQIQKFVQGRDREWKPYLACILGLDHEAVHQKYVIDDELDAVARRRDIKRLEVQPQNVDRGELVTRIDIAADDIHQISEQLDSFDFSAEERRISKRLVDEIESRISEINSDLYDLDLDIAQLEQSLGRGIKFDLARIREIFEDSKIAFPEAITRSYEELVNFNKMLTKERNAALRARGKELAERRHSLSIEHNRLDEERQRLLRIIKDADTFRKYKALQGELVERRASLAFLEGQLERIDELGILEQELRDLRKKRDDYVTQIEQSLVRGSPIRTNVTLLFNRYVKEVLNISGQFIVGLNRSGNLDFEIKTTDATGNDTSQSEGHTYRKLLCALFDLAVLKALEEMPFYHFVYHDGILEGLDDRKKLNVLELIRKIISVGRIQSIISVIESDLPRSVENDSSIPFASNEIILELDDHGDSGRLFKMKPF